MEELIVAIVIFSAIFFLYHRYGRLKKIHKKIAEGGCGCGCGCSDCGQGKTKFFFTGFGKGCQMKKEKRA